MNATWTDPTSQGRSCARTPIGWRVIFQQLDLVSGAFEDREGEFRSGHAGYLAGQGAGVMSPMREFEPEDVAPKGERPFQVRHGDAGVIGGDDVKWLSAHLVPRIA